MAYLHNETKIFEDIVFRTSVEQGISPAFVVKDYFIYEMLKTMIRINPSVVFKGGTSLSKCHHVINRFSEDIDLGLEVEHATEGQRKKMKSMVIRAAEEHCLKITNIDATRSKRAFNKFILPLPSVEKFAFISDTLIIETAVMTPASPCVQKNIGCLIGDFCRNNNYADITEEFLLQEFALKVNSLERTYVDKIYALCDYYLSGAIPARQSRHIYDLYKLQNHIVFNDDLAALINEVGSQRRGLFRCYSAKPDVCLAKVIAEIDNNHAYEKDYGAVTCSLLYEDVSYDEARKALLELCSFLSEFEL